jgi:hypothetical protein
MSLVTAANYIRFIADKYGFYTGLFNMIVGLVGNTCIILLFTNVKLFRGNQCSFYMTVESFSNIGLLIAIYLTRYLTIILGYDPLITSLAWCKMRSLMSQVFGLCSLYTICFTTFDQYLSTNHRYSFRQISTLKLAHRLTIFNVSIVILHSILFLIYIEIYAAFGCTVYNLIVKRYFSFFYYPILSSALPLIVTASFSLMAYHNVRHIIRRQMPVIRRRLDRQLTAMVLARVICIIILGFPYIFSTLYQLNANISEDNDTELAINGLVGAITYSLLYTNFSVSSNIIFYI